MRIAELLVLYVLAGVGCAVALAAARVRSASPVALDAALLVPLWPLYGPFLLAQGGVTGPSDDAPAVELLRALAKARGTPMAAFLPDESSGRALARRLRLAGDRIAEIDVLLAQPEFSEAEALARHEQFRERDPQVAAAALKRMQNIRRLRTLRDRFSAELDQVSELLKQLRIQAEVVRLAGTSDDGVRELVHELLARVEGLDEVLQMDERRG